MSSQSSLLTLRNAGAKASEALAAAQQVASSAAARNANANVVCFFSIEKTWICVFRLLALDWICESLNIYSWTSRK
jgi:hypothetical protein